MRRRCPRLRLSVGPVLQPPPALPLAAFAAAGSVGRALFPPRGRELVVVGLAASGSPGVSAPGFARMVCGKAAARSRPLFALGPLRRASLSARALGPRAGSGLPPVRGSASAPLPSGGAAACLRVPRWVALARSASSVGFGGCCPAARLGRPLGRGSRLPLPVPRFARLRFACPLRVPPPGRGRAPAGALFRACGAPRRGERREKAAVTYVTAALMFLAYSCNYTNFTAWINTGK